MLEGSSSGESGFESGSELLDQSPRVESIEEVDVTGGSRQNWTMRVGKI
jgi:hypothetical protein